LKSPAESGDKISDPIDILPVQRNNLISKIEKSIFISKK